MKWEVRFRDGTSEPVEAESAYVNQVGTLLFLKKATPPAPAEGELKKKKPGWPKKAATVTVRGFNANRWDDFVLVDE